MTQVVPSWTLSDVQYQVAEVMRWRRRQLARLLQADGHAAWVEVAELAGNVHCMLVHQVRAWTWHAMWMMSKCSLQCRLRNAIGLPGLN